MFHLSPQLTPLEPLPPHTDPSCSDRPSVETLRGVNESKSKWGISSGARGNEARSSTFISNGNGDTWRSNSECKFVRSSRVMRSRSNAFSVRSCSTRWRCESLSLLSSQTRSRSAVLLTRSCLMTPDRSVSFGGGLCVPMRSSKNCNSVSYSPVFGPVSLYREVSDLGTW